MLTEPVVTSLDQEAMTCRLQEVRPHAPSVLAAAMPQVIALAAIAALGLSGAPVHEPVHVSGRPYSGNVTERSSRTVRSEGLLEDVLDEFG